MNVCMVCMCVCMLHRGSVLPTCTGPMICLDDQYEDEFYRSTIPVLGGASAVPEGYGLGIDVDEAEVSELNLNCAVAIHFK